MNRAIVFRAMPADGTEQETRMLIMSDSQQAVFSRVTQTLAEESSCPTEHAEALAEGVIVRMLGTGKLPDEGAPESLLALRFAFPRLTGDQIRALPRMGCPEGRIEAIVPVISSTDGVGSPEIRSVFYPLDEEQADWVAGHLKDVPSAGFDRDVAFLLVVEYVSLCITGLKQGDPVFPSLTPEEINELREPTLQELMRWCFVGGV